MNPRPLEFLPSLARLATVAVFCALCAATNGAENLPREGMALRLSADQGVEIRDGRVVGRRDRSATHHIAEVPAGFAGPSVDATQSALHFTHKTLPSINLQVLPADAREITILGVGQVDEIETDVCVVGAGSAGIGAAVAAARRGARVVLIEREARLGGTGTNAYVANWEPGPGCSLAEEIYLRMKADGGAGVATGYPVQTKAPMGYILVTDGFPYEATLRRAGIPGSEYRRVPYKPEAFDRVVRDMLDETGKVTLLDRTTFFQAETNPEKTRVESVLAEASGGRLIRIRAKVFIDSTGCVWLCRALGCEVMLGVDPRSRFDEPSAPEQGSLQLNAISRCYLIRPNKTREHEPAPEADVRFPKCAFVTGWKDGLQAVNPMPMLPGRALIDHGYDECLRCSEQMARAHWHWLQQIPEFQGYELAEIAPMLGIRESYRVVTRYVLNENDLLAGLPGQKHDDIIAVADHPCDIHGAGGQLSEVKTAYGIPYRCLLPAGSWSNLLVACRGAGFSKIAASSCRLQRTMLQIGHAAGIAAAMASQRNVPVDRIEVRALVEDLDARSRYPY
jgi:hypothetical protein